MKEGLERRGRERKPTEGTLRVYSSLGRGALTIKLSDVHEEGAFVKTKRLPVLGEIMTYEVRNEDHKRVFTGSAKVVWIKESVRADENGFGLKFEGEIAKHLLELVNKDTIPPFG